MDILRFTGVVVDGCGLFARQLVLPNRPELSVPIRDWPECPQQGTLNVLIQDAGFPADFLVHFPGPDIRHLDTRRFEPEAELKWREIGGNTLPPTPGDPDRGNAQVWRSVLRRCDTREEKRCWVLRRLGSGLWQHLELVAGEKLRGSLALANRTVVEVDVEGRWKNA